MIVIKLNIANGKGKKPNLWRYGYEVTKANNTCFFLYFSLMFLWFLGSPFP